MFITLTRVDEFGGGTNPCAFNINQIQYFYPVDTDDPEEKPEWNVSVITVIVSLLF